MPEQTLAEWKARAEAAEAAQAAAETRVRLLGGALFVAIQAYDEESSPIGPAQIAYSETLLAHTFDEDSRVCVRELPADLLAADGAQGDAPEGERHE